MIAIDSVIPDYMPGYRTRISVFLSILNVHVNRIPCAGRISRIEYHRGKFKPAFTESAAAENEHSIIEMASAHGNIGFCQRAGTLARRISCNLRVGQDVQTGERFGMIRFGSRVDLYLPENIDILVRKGMKVKAGETVLAEFIGNES